MLWPGDSKRARFKSRCCPLLLFRRRRFYSKRLFLGAFANEVASNKRVSLASQLIRSHGQPGCARARIHSRPRCAPQLDLKINYNCGSNIMHVTSSKVELRSSIDA